MVAGISPSSCPRTVSYTHLAEKGLDKDKKNENGSYIRRERYIGQCSRSFYIGEGIEQKDIHAKFEDGILKLSIPKKEQPKLEENKYIAIEG